MSDEPTTATTDETPQKQYGIAWGDEIDETRKQELWARLRAWWDEKDHGKRLGPYDQEILTGAEVFWLAVCAVAKQERTTLHKAEQRLRSTQLTVDLEYVQLQGVTLAGAQLQDAKLNYAQLQGAQLTYAQLQGADLHNAQLDGANLEWAQLQNANLQNARLQDAVLNQAQLQGANFSYAQLQRANFELAELQGAIFSNALMQEATLGFARLQEAIFWGAHLEGAILDNANLTQAELRNASLDKATSLNDAILTGVCLDQTILDGTNLSVVNWDLVPVLQDERLAHQTRSLVKNLEKHRQLKSPQTCKAAYQAAARAYRRLVVALQANGMSEEAAGYAYRAQLMQRAVYRYSGWQALGQWLFSWFLWLIAGYGYKPLRSVGAYLVIIFGFMGLYLLNGHFVAPHLTWDEALVLSVSSFHGRGFFSQNITLGDTYARLAALEAVFGLLIEISFIATFTQRFFGAK